MPTVHLHLLKLSSTLQSFTVAAKSELSSHEILAASIPRFLFIPATTQDAKKLNNTQWDLLLILRDSKELPDSLAKLVRNRYSIAVGVPGKLLASYPEQSAKLRQKASSVPLTGALDAVKSKPSFSEGSELEVSSALLAFMDSMEDNGEGNAPVSMLNLLQFNPGKKEDYIKYGQGFSKAGGKRGGNAKLVGIALDQEDPNGWNEIAFVHYPSIKHFVDMVASDDYQEINRKYRLAALKDTFLLCTTEVDLFSQPPTSKL